MCGVIGILNYGKLNPEMEKIRRDVSIFLTTELIRETEIRGKDATGLSVMFETGKFMGLKMGIAAKDFLVRYGDEPTDYEGFVNLWKKCPDQTKMVIAHCRKSSVGNTTDNVNNHPIKVGELVGVHNGTLTNHEIIFKRLECKRDGVVDSEAILRLYHHYTKAGTEPFNIDMIYQIHKRLQGAYTTLVMNGNNPYQLAATREGRPMELRFFRELNMMVIASEKTFLDSVFSRYNQQGRIYNNGWPLATKVSFMDRTVQDSTLLLFNLETPVNNDTKIEELYVSKDVWKDCDTLENWRVVGQNSNGYTSINGEWCPVKKQYVKKGTAQVVKAASVIATPNLPVSGMPALPPPNPTQPSIQNSTSQNSYQKSYTGSADKEYGPAGRDVMVFNRDLEKFVKCEHTAKKAGDLRGKPSMIIRDGKLVSESEITKEVTKLSTSMREEEKELNQELVTTPAKVTDFSTTGEKSETDGEIIEVDMVVTTLAENFAEVTPHFETPEEVAEAIGAVDVQTLKKTPIAILANKIMKMGIIRGYIKGHEDVACSQDKQTDQTGNLQKNFRVLKTMAKLLARLTSKTSTLEIDTAVSESLASGEEINSKTLEIIFSSGDKEKFPVLGIATKLVKDKENR